jgi:hypothetical protein
MLRRSILLLTLLALAAPFCVAQETPASVVTGYDALADTILALRRAEPAFVAAFLDGHRHGAKARLKAGDYEGCAAEMALFANEGDNAIGGVRKKLLEGGHHYNAEGEEKGIFEPGYVIVTKQAKVDILAAAKEMREATDDEGRKAAWMKFAEIADDLLKME